MALDSNDLRSLHSRLFSVRRQMEPYQGFFLLYDEELAEMLGEAYDVVHELLEQENLGCQHEAGDR